MFGPIFWTQFSWEAFATLATGVAAVFAAAFVGLRQLRILTSQNELKEQEIRVSLLDRRLQVYDDIHSFLADIMRSGNEAGPEFQQRFIRARLNARFLFSSELNEFLDEIWTKNVSLGLYNTLSNSKNAKNEKDRIANVHKSADTMKWLVDAFGKLHEKFAEIRPLHTGQETQSSN